MKEIVPAEQHKRVFFPSIHKCLLLNYVYICEPMHEYVGVHRIQNRVPDTLSRVTSGYDVLCGG